MSRTIAHAPARKYAVAPAPTSGGWLKLLVVFAVFAGVSMGIAWGCLAMLRERPIATGRLYHGGKPGDPTTLFYRADMIPLQSGAAAFQVPGGSRVDVLEHRMSGARSMARVRTAEGYEGWTYSLLVEDVRAMGRD